MQPSKPESPASVTHLLYLHGFRSSPQSAKARRMAAIVAAEHPAVTWWCPQLPPSPRAAMRMLMDGIAGWPSSPGFQRMAVVGSSLGGFYATHVAESTGCKAVLLNPAVDPARDLAKYIGEQTAWHDDSEKFFFAPEFVDELRALETGPLIAPANYLAVIAKGDEVLDWREMTTRYHGATVKLLEGGDHALSDFDDHLPQIMDFLNLA
ncbi:MAG: esterase [Comamonadaceae bacterium]|nr:MAG: esterase [Comamonadaceae bacterium]